MSEITETEVVKHITNSLNEMYAKGYADGLNSLSKLTIPKWVADELQEAIGEANWKGTPYSVILRADGYLYLFSSLRGKKLSERVYAFCRDNNRLFDAYLNPLTRDLVKVVEG